MMPDFWNERFQQKAYVYGTGPNAFLVEAATYLPDGSAVVELGSGEGRNAVWLAEQGFEVTAVDYSMEGLDKTRRLAQAREVDVETIQADLTTWSTDRQWEAAVTIFLHLPPPHQERLYDLMKRIVRPGGWVIAEWFRPEQVTEGYTSGGPPREEMMVTRGELSRHFGEAGMKHLQEANPVLDEGPYHQGRAATVRMVWQKPVGGGSAAE